MNNKGILTILSGFSGVGKGTIVKEIMAKYDNYALSVSATTRSPRPGEEDGTSYFFKSKEEFEEMINDNKLLEYANYVGNYYGTPREYVENKLNEGKDVILEIEIQGARQVKKLMPEAISVFVMPPDAKTLKDRLIGRGTESLEVINKRLSRAVTESEGIEEYDFILVNDDLSESVERLNSIIMSSHNHSYRNKEFIDSIREDVSVFSEGE
ncbi:MAG: guanylate kinase [Lachnospiraceae bacterium]|nr:guanylate kinase [Lachnospiraceae bacterium]